MEWVLSVNKLVKEFMQKDLLHEKRKRVNEGEASPLSPRRSGSIIQRPASFYAPANAASPTSSPRGSGTPHDTHTHTHTHTHNRLRAVATREG